MRDAFMDQSTGINITTTDRYEEEIAREETQEDESLWDKIKDAFTVDDEYEDDTTHPDGDPLLNYRTKIEDGKIVVLVESEKMTTGKATTDDETFRLKEERLDVDTKEVQVGEVHVSKRVVEETQTIEVPVEHEEIVVKRRPVDSEHEARGNMAMKEEDIVIPLTEEKINVTKEPVITEEVTIEKRKVTDTKHVTEKVEKEVLDVDTEGDVDVNNDLI